MTSWFRGSLVALGGIAFSLFGCGPSAKNTATEFPSSTAPTDGQEATTPPPVSKDAELAGVCQRMKELADEGCEPFSDWSELIASCEMTASMYMAGANMCLAETTCKGVRSCWNNADELGAPYAGITTMCNATMPDDTWPVGLSDVEVALRYGESARTFADAPSSAARPIEVCGFQGELDYLTRVTCLDGSNPFASRSDAHQARVGNAGPGGQCKRIVDRYTASCPEQTYDVFIDAYRCPETL